MSDCSEPVIQSERFCKPADFGHLAAGVHFSLTATMVEMTTIPVQELSARGAGITDGLGIWNLRRTA